MKYGFFVVSKMDGKTDPEWHYSGGISKESGLQVLTSCVESIRSHHPDAPIYVIDSASDNQNYHPHIEEKYNATVDYAQNKNYTVGATYHVFKNYPDFEYYFFLQDAQVVHTNLEYCLNFDLSTYSYFNSHNGVGRIPGREWGFKNQESVDLGERLLKENTGYAIPDLFTGCWGSIMFCKRHVLEALNNVGYFKMLPTNKLEDQVMERLTGIVLENVGFDLKENSLRNTHRITKTFRGRM